ncbi:MAG: hypothetical protein AAFN77_01630 [Planctomycetota bacterium]
MNKCILSLTLTLAIVASAASVAHGQDRQQQRRVFIQDLLKDLVESQLNRGNDPRGEVFPGQYPNQYPYPPGTQIPPRVNPNPRPGRRPVEIEVAPEMIQVRNSLNSWNSAATNLVAELRLHENESPQLRPLLADALKFQANLTAVGRRASLLPTVQPLTNDFVALDRDWRVLSTQLKQSRALPRKCAGMINTITELDTQLCGLFQIQPQINRPELARLATTLANDYDHLLRGVYYSARGKRGADELLRQGQQLQTMIGQAASLINRGDYETIVTAFKKCNGEWRSFSQRVLRLQDERLRFSVQHIEDTGRRIQEQLWLPFELDRPYLASLVDAINADAQQVFNSITIGQLMATEQPGNMLAMAREFQQTCATFSRQLSGDTPEDQLEWSYRLFATKWQRMHDAYHTFQLAAVDHRLEDIEFSMNSLGEIFGNEFVMGHDEIVHLYSELDALCKQASFDIHRRITDRRYERQFHDQLCGLADGLSQSVYGLHRMSIRPNYRPTAEQLQPMFDNWIAMRPLLAQCKPEDQAYFAEFRRQIEPMMVKLQVLYSN